MRLLGIFIAVVLRAKSAPVCSQSGNGSFMETGGEWYFALIYCVQQHQAGPTTPTVPSDFYSCLNTLDGLSDRPSITMAGSLVAGLNVETRSQISSSCHRCAFDFAMAVFASDLGMCTDNSGKYTAISVKYSGCQWSLYKAINAFNTCSGNGYDIVHKTVSTRCTSDEFIDFAIAHNPLSPITQCVYEDTALISVSAITKCVGPSFIADKANLGCKSCFDPLITGIRDSTLTTCIGADGRYEYTDDCMAAIFNAADAFGICSGGLEFRVWRPSGVCSVEQKRVIDVMRPYKNAMQCGFIDGTSACLTYHNSIQQALDLLDDDGYCSGRVHSIAGGVFFSQESKDVCRSDFFGTACTDYIENVYQLLYLANTSIGMKLDVTSTKCTSIGWDESPNSHKSYIPFVRCAMKGTSPGDVLDCVETDELVVSVLESVSCASCYKQLAIEAYVARVHDASGLTAVACIDPYTQGCLEALVKPMSIFKDCSGFDAKIISNGECSTDSIPRDAGLAAVVALVATSRTATEALFRYSKIARNLGINEFPCEYCHIDLIVPLFNLSDANKAICIADIESWGCYMVLGAYLDNFYRCTRGWSSTAATSTARESYVPQLVFNFR